MPVFTQQYFLGRSLQFLRTMLSFAKAVIFYAFVAYASAANVITSVTASTNLVPGQPFTITWQPDSSSTISLILRKGDASNLDTVGYIANNIPNTGTYTWYPENTLPGGSDYALEILSTDGTPNYSHFFGISNAGVTASATTGGSTSAAIKTTTLPESLLTDSLISDSTSATVLIVSGNSTMTSVSSMASSASASRNSSATSRSASSTTRSSSQTIASATTSASSASVVGSGIIGGTGLLTIIALSLASMLFCMM
jgi:hypothetical protein